MKLEAAIKGFLMDWQLRDRSAKTLGLPTAPPCWSSAAGWPGRGWRTWRR